MARNHAKLRCVASSGLPPVHRHSAREVMENLSFMEFSDLCQMVDEFGPRSEMKINLDAQTLTVAIAGKLITKRFHVLEVKRFADKVVVLLDFGACRLEKYELKSKIHGNWLETMYLNVQPRSVA